VPNCPAPWTECHALILWHMLPVPLCQTTVRRERRLHNSLSRNFHHVLVCIGPWLAARIRVPIEINRARLIYQYVPVFFKLAHFLQRIFRAFWVHIDVHNNYFYFANKSYFRKIMGVKFKKKLAFRLKRRHLSSRKMPNEINDMIFARR